LYRAQNPVVAGQPIFCFLSKTKLPNFQKESANFSAFGGVAQKRKEFLRLLLKKFCKTCYTEVGLNIKGRPF
jgi:hypothetical protein